MIHLSDQPGFWASFSLEIVGSSRKNWLLAYFMLSLGGKRC
jgi:hypothetical protein